MRRHVFQVEQPNASASEGSARYRRCADARDENVKAPVADIQPFRRSFVNSILDPGFRLLF
jgi:hypothetical protein